MAAPVTLHVFCSAKGGVGKSTLSVTAAKLMASLPGRRCILVDADLTGTSLADGLDLCAPRTHTRVDGSLDLDVLPDAGFHTGSETRGLRAGRRFAKWTDVAPPPPYLNDVLIHRPEEAPDGRDSSKECLLSTVLWRHECDDGALYLPSSPLARDVSIALGWLYDEKAFSWIQRMAWLFHAMREQVAGLTDIIVDLPPGLFGFAHEMLVLVSHVARGAALPPGYPDWHTVPGAWRARAYLVMSPDRNDLRVATEYFAEQRVHIPTLVPLVNRRTADLSATQDTVREQVGDVGVAEMLGSVAEMPSSLGRLFVSGDLPLTGEIQGLLEIFAEREVS